MWMKFSSRRNDHYMIKIYVGGVNAISGEPAVEDAATKLRRQAKLAKVGVNSHISPLQDYIVVPGQLWLDGIADSDGTVRQFVAMPFGSGHSVEAQITGKDTTGGIQIEVTPYKPQTIPKFTLPSKVGSFEIFVKTVTGKTLKFGVELSDTIKDLMYRIRDVEDVSFAEQRLVYNGRQPDDHQTLLECGIREEATLHLVGRLLGGVQPREHQMSIAAGGKIHQSITADNLGTDWLPGRTTVFNVQILNSAVYKSVTGEAPPTKPVDPCIYEHYDLPFFKLYEEPSGIHGDFGLVKSVAQIDGKSDAETKPRTVIIANGHDSVGIGNPKGPFREFRTVADLEKELGQVHVASF